MPYAARHVGHIYVVPTVDGLIGERAGRDQAGVWQLVSDNPNKHLLPTRLWSDDAAVVGEVKWAVRTLARGKGQWAGARIAALLNLPRATRTAPGRPPAGGLAYLALLAFLACSG